MIKQVEINGVTYTLKSSVGTIKDYKQEFNKEYTQVIQRFINVKKKADGLSPEEASAYWLSQITKMNEDILSLAYVMIKEAKLKGENKTFDYSYEDWLRTLDSIDPKSYLGVMECANAVFQGNLPRK